MVIDAVRSTGVGTVTIVFLVALMFWVSQGLTGWGWTVSLLGAALVAPAIGCILLAGSIPQTLEDGFARILGVQPVSTLSIPLSRAAVTFGVVLLPLLGTLLVYILMGETVGVSFVVTGFSVIMTLTCMSALVGMSVRRSSVAMGLWGAILALSACSVYAYLFARPSSEIALRLVHLLPILLAAEGLGFITGPWSTGLGLSLAGQAFGSLFPLIVAAKWGWAPEEPRGAWLKAAWLIQVVVLLTPVWLLGIIG